MAVILYCSIIPPEPIPATLKEGALDSSCVIIYLSSSTFRTVTLASRSVQQASTEDRNGLVIFLAVQFILNVASSSLPLPSPLPPHIDTHTRTSNLSVPAGDVLIHAGDFSNIGLPKDIEKFKQFLDSLPHKHKVLLLGPTQTIGVDI